MWRKLVFRPDTYQIVSQVGIVVRFGWSKHDVFDPSMLCALENGKKEKKTPYDPRFALRCDASHAYEAGLHAHRGDLLIYAVNPQ